MPEYCTCGAKLPEDARFCHKCGKPQFEYPVADSEPEVPLPAPAAAAAANSDEISFHNRIAVRVSFLAALLAFLVTAFPLPPFITVIRLLVCFVAAGFLAVYIYKRRTGQTITIRGGARLGWMTGIFSFTIATVLVAGTVLSLSAFREQLAGKNPEVDQFIRMMDDRATMAGVLLMVLIILFVLYTLLPMVGGMLCVKVLEKDG